MIVHPHFAFDCNLVPRDRKVSMWRRFFAWLLSTVAPILVQQAAEKVAKPGDPKPPAQ